MRDLFSNRNFSIFLAGAAAIVVSTTIFGVIRNYSAIPFWDMWNGYLEFYFRSGEGWAPWWELHNEHRLVLAKALFWIDLKVFSGSLIFLFTLNLVFALLNFTVFSLFLRDIIEKKNRLSSEPLFWILIILSFSWIQHENFTWAFQSQFFMAYLLPLYAFYLLGKSGAVEGTLNLYFAGALLCGILSSVTMANGLLALPLLTLLSIFQKGKIVHTLLLLSFSLAIFGIYFYDYESPYWHGSWSETLANDSKSVVVYFLAYLGAPVYILTGKSAVLPAVLLGVTLICSSIWMSWPILKGQRVKDLDLSLLAFILFIGGTALSTALGRATLDSELANFLPSRYQTPSVMAWCALFLLLYSRHPKNFLKPPFQIGIALIIVAVLLSFQAKTFKYATHLIYQEAAVVASQLEIRDNLYISMLYFDENRFHDIRKRATDLDLSIAKMPRVAEANNILGSHYSSIPEDNCIAHVDRIDELPLFNSPGHGIRIEGWIYEPNKNLVPEAVVLTNQEMRVIGYGITGLRREDVAAVHSRNAIHSGFIAYLNNPELQDDRNQPLIISALRPQCRIEVRLPLE